MLAIVRDAIEPDENILISGGTSTGKTTLLNALAAFLPHDDRIVLIEDTAELQLDRPNLVRFEARREQGRLPAVTIRDLLTGDAASSARSHHRRRGARRGSVRPAAGAEYRSLRDRSPPSTRTPPQQALARFASCVVQSGVELPYQAVRYQIADAIDVVLHLGRDRGVRVVKELIKVERYDVQRDGYDHAVLYQASGAAADTIPIPIEETSGSSDGARPSAFRGSGPPVPR